MFHLTSNFLMFNDLFSPLMFTIVKLKRRLAITKSVSYDLGSCPFTPAFAIPNIIRTCHLDKINRYDHN